MTSYCFVPHLSRVYRILDLCLFSDSRSLLLLTPLSLSLYIVPYFVPSLTFLPIFTRIRVNLASSVLRESIRRLDWDWKIFVRLFETLLGNFWLARSYRLNLKPIVRRSISITWRSWERYLLHDEISFSSVSEFFHRFFWFLPKKPRSSFNPVETFRGSKVARFYLQFYYYLKARSLRFLRFFVLTRVREHIRKR